MSKRDNYCMESLGRVETLQSIADKLGVTRERVRQIELNALRKLANNKEAQKLFFEVCGIKRGRIWEA